MVLLHHAEAFTPDTHFHRRTHEFLVYLTGMNFCGSGGCNLYIVTDTGRLISKLTVTDFPIYVAANTADAQPGSWNDVIVWSNGSFRKLSYHNGKYPSNPSVAPAIEKSAVIGGQYQLVLGGAQ